MSRDSVDSNEMTVAAQPGLVRSLVRVTRNRSTILPLVGVAVGLLSWQVVAMLMSASYLLPTPVAVTEYAVQHLDLLAVQSANTLKVTFAGLVISIVVAVGLAAVMVAVRVVREAIYPLVVATQVVPKVALAPLVVVYFGFGFTSKAVIAFLVAFFPLLITTMQGLASVDPELVDLMRVSRASRWTILRKARIPNALPYFMDGLKISFTLAIIGAIVAEFQAGNEGLGYLLQTGVQNLLTELSFAALVILTIEGLVIYWAIDVIGKRLVPWAPSIRSGNEGARLP